MLKQWISKLKLNNGFSLVEALITVVIVGIAMIPVSMVFTQTINTTVSTRKLLEANELGQEYIETLKSKDFSDLLTVFNGANSRTIDNSYNQATYDLMGIEPLPEGYRAVITYDDSSVIDLTNFALPTNPNTMPPVNAIVTIPSGDSSRVDLQVTPTDAAISYPVPATTSTERVIKVIADRSTNTMKVVYINSLTTEAIVDARFSVDITGVSSPALRFIMGNSPNSGTLITTRIDVQSDLPSEIKLYIYEDESNSVKAATKVINGFVSISRNLNNVDGTQKRIVGLKVDIYDSLSNELLTTFSTTKVDE